MPEYSFPLTRGPYQDNGASPWYCEIPVGSQGLSMKLAIDTGTNMDWVTSTQCTTEACTRPGRVRFDPAQSSSFAWVDRKPVPLKYGPWGVLTANIGRDEFALPGGQQKQPFTFGLAIDYHGEKFDEVDWDGCLAMPARDPMQHEMSFAFENMVNNGLIPPDQAFFGYETDAASGTGTCILGGYDVNRMDTGSMLYIPYSLYSTSDGSIGYVWSSPLQQVLFGGTRICANATFCLDTGSSRFKGDETFMSQILKMAANALDDLEILVGRGISGDTGHMIVPPSIYEVTIEKGNKAGTRSPQFHTLDGVPGLFLAGSVLMDQLYTIYQYSSSRDPATGRYQLSPLGAFVTNKPGGPKVIQNYTGASVDIAQVLKDNLQTAQGGNTA